MGNSLAFLALIYPLSSRHTPLLHSLVPLSLNLLIKVPTNLQIQSNSDEELERWNGLPPYTKGLENKPSQWLSANVQNLSDALWGKRLRQQHELEVSRIRRYKSVPHTDLIVEIYEDLSRCLQSWEGANRVMEQFSRDEVAVLELGVQYVQWMARRTLQLWEDYQALNEGSDAILRAYVERWIHVL